MGAATRTSMGAGADQLCAALTASARHTERGQLRLLAIVDAPNSSVTIETFRRRMSVHGLRLGMTTAQGWYTMTRVGGRKARPPRPGPWKAAVLAFRSPRVRSTVLILKRQDTSNTSIRAAVLLSHLDANGQAPLHRIAATPNAMPVGGVASVVAAKLFDWSAGSQWRSLSSFPN